MADKISHKRLSGQFSRSMVCGLGVGVSVSPLSNSLGVWHFGFWVHTFSIQNLADYRWNSAKELQQSFDSLLQAVGCKHLYNKKLPARCLAYWA